MKNTLRYVTADVFTTVAYGGNPLAVVLDGRGLSDAHMQKVAREFNLSETTFILPPTNPAHAARVRIFTPATELPFAGHPTVGTAWVMAARGLLPRAGDTAKAVFEEGVGPVPLTIRFADGAPTYVSFTTAIVPEVLAPPPAPADLAAMLNLAPPDLRGEGTPPLSLTCGTPYTCVPLRSVDAVGRARLDLEHWRKHLSATPAHKVFVFARADANTLQARMFAPGEGVAEDPATGSAACAVTEWLVRDDGLKTGTGRWTIDQGIEMGRPSRIFVEADVAQGEITAVRCGGSVVVMSEGELRRPEDA
ncbi:MAG: PhzF family phenazine biosynthesis protein [Rhodospirillaceae bacterium]|nr:PhzF family phenazine biosynthesis protein [Rhodospirillaceae bacterium]